jgi:hypothetical protein
MREIGHFIGGKAVKGSSDRFGDVFDPNTKSSMPSPTRRRRSLPGRRLTRSVALASCSSFSS